MVGDNNKPFWEEGAEPLSRRLREYASAAVEAVDSHGEGSHLWTVLTPVEKNVVMMMHFTAFDDLFGLQAFLAREHGYNHVGPVGITVEKPI